MNMQYYTEPYVTHMNEHSTVAHFYGDCFAELTLDKRKIMNIVLGIVATVNLTL